MFDQILCTVSLSVSLHGDQTGEFVFRCSVLDQNSEKSPIPRATNPTFC